MDSSKPPETERLLMAANLHRLRGEVNEAEVMVRTALQQHPSDYFARELLGDLLLQKGDHKGAEAEYRSLLQDSPGRPNVEDKLARLILRSTPIPVVTATGAELRTDRKPVTAAVCSFFFPGAGHFYIGDKVKGLIFGSIGVLLLFATLPSLMGSFHSISGAVSGGLDPTGAETGVGVPDVSGIGQVALWGLLFTALQIYTAYDSFVMARNVYRP